MPHTYTDLHAHIVFGTRDREPRLVEAIQPRVFSYIDAILRDLGLTPIRIGGWVDHIHILTGFRSTHRIADQIRDIKSRSSGWIVDEIDRAFHWQRGYAAFTVSRNRIEAVSRYIARQVEHHRRKTFEEELIELLEQAAIEVDRRYLWT